MRKILKTTFHLDRIVCYDEADGLGSAEPYMWTVFFKIDGDTCKLNDSLMLEGTATVFTTPGSHGNLNNTDVDGGDTVPVPAAIGLQEMILTPIPVPDFVKQLGTDDVSAIAGCIVVLMEEDNVSDAGAEAGHRALNEAIQNALDGLIPTLGFSNQAISDSDINTLINKITAQITNAIENQQNAFENFWSWLNADDTIGSVVWKFSGDDLLRKTPIALDQRWPNEAQPSDDNGDWELFGTITTEEIPTCPATVVEAIFDALFGESSSKKSMRSMYDFRDKDMKQYNGLGLWWQIIQRNSLYLKRALNDKGVSEAALSLFKAVPDILGNKEKPITDSQFDAAMKVLTHISTLNTKDRQSRKDVTRLIDTLQLLKGKTLHDMFTALSGMKPARYPSIGSGSAPAPKKKK